MMLRISHFISRYGFKYVRSLVYMLQVSEYSVSDYLSWFHRTSDFNHVEKRKRLVMTTKAKILLYAGWIIVIIFYIAIIGILFIAPSPIKYIFFLAAYFLVPYVVVYMLLVLLGIIRLIQWPIEYRIIARARTKLSKHSGLKIAVAGSYGKTSMREILKTVLSESGSQVRKVASPPHSYNTPLGISRFIESLQGDEDILIFELGEYYPGDVMKLCRLVQPDMGIITGINEAHLEKFRTLERTAKTIFELADWLGDKELYVNSESNLALQQAQKESHHVGSIFYNREGIGKWKIKDAYADLTGTSFTLYSNGEITNTSSGDKHMEIKLRSGLLGLHQIGPLAVTAVIALKLNYLPQDIQKGIALTKPFEHRLELNIDAQGVYMLDDSYNGNPSGVKVLIEFLGGLKQHRRFYVTPGLVEMGSKTEEIHRNIGRQLAEAGIEKVVLIRNSVTPYIELGLIDSHFTGEIIWFDDALTTYASLPHMTLKGDVVLLQNDWPDQYF